MGSDAVGQDRVSRVIGYVLKKANFQNSSPNLPIRINLIGEANHANQSDIDADVPIEITSAKQAGELFGYGSPVYNVMRILRPVSSEGVGGLSTVVYPQAEPGGATARIVHVTPSGVATGNGTHFLRIAGRTSIDGKSYAININEGDTVGDITQKIEDAVNGLLVSPMTATSTMYEVTLTTKWRGLTAQGVVVNLDLNDTDLGISYSVSQTQAASGTPDVGDALTAFGNAWAPFVLNSYGFVTTVIDALEATNGIPKDLNPTGRYQGTTFKPFIAITGSVENDASVHTDSHKDDVTIAMAVAPLSEGLAMEAAANWLYNIALTASNNPHLDVAGQFLPDMPVPVDSIIGSQADYNLRDNFVKKGCSTVDLVSGRYQIQDCVTTYHPDGENVPAFRYVRDLIVDFNVRYGYMLLEQINVVDHVIANDDDKVTAQKIIKPKIWKSILATYAEDLVARGLTTDADFMIGNIAVQVSSSNPNRLETTFKYKRSGFVRISATTAEAGFSFGTLNA